MKRPLAVPYLVLVLVDIQILNRDILHGIRCVAPNNTGGDQGMEHIDVAQRNVFKSRTALCRAYLRAW